MASTGYDAVIEHVASGDPEGTVAACQQALAGGAPAQEIVTRGLSKGMRKIARDLNKKGMYLDTMLGSSFAFNAGLDAVRSQLERERGAPEGTVVLGVMDGPWTIGTGSGGNIGAKSARPATNSRSAVPAATNAISSPRPAHPPKKNSASSASTTNLPARSRCSIPSAPR